MADNDFEYNNEEEAEIMTPSLVSDPVDCYSILFIHCE